MFPKILLTHLLLLTVIPPILTIFTRHLRNLEQLSFVRNFSDPVDENKTTVEVLNPDYWKQWHCTHDHERFLDMFYALLLANRNKCPLKTDSESRSLEHTSIRKRSATDAAHVAPEHPEDILGFPVEPTDLTESNASETHQLKRLRGCKWENMTHSCHQYILFSILEPECNLKSSDYVEDEDDGEYDTEDELIQEPERPSNKKVWLYGFICCTAEIFVARLGVILMPLLRKDLYEKFIIAMIGLAAGTLTGSSIFHLLPKAFSLEGNSNRLDKQYLNRCLVIALGLWGFLMIERILKIFFHHNERKLCENRTKKIRNVLAVPTNKNYTKSVAVISHFKTPDELVHHGRKLSDGSEDSYASYVHGDSFISQTSDNRSTCLGSSGSQPSVSKFRIESNELPEVTPIKFQEGSLALVSTQAWMIIVGDSFLDFVDGLSIGTAFHDSILTGFSISLGILLEEFPHELGEFAVLLNAGLSFRQAFLLKLISSCSTYVGLCVGVYLGGVEAGHYVFALAAGMFLYIALVDMVPELNEVAFKSSKSSVFKGVKVLILQNVGLLVGMSLIYLMALYEDVFKKF